MKILKLLLILLFFVLMVQVESSVAKIKFKLPGYTIDYLKRLYYNKIPVKINDYVILQVTKYLVSEKKYNFDFFLTAEPLENNTPAPIKGISIYIFSSAQLENLEYFHPYQQFVLKVYQPDLKEQIIKEFSDPGIYSFFGLNHLYMIGASFQEETDNLGIISLRMSSRKTRIKIVTETYIRQEVE